MIASFLRVQHRKNTIWRLESQLLLLVLLQFMKLSKKSILHSGMISVTQTKKHIHLFVRKLQEQVFYWFIIFCSFFNPTFFHSHLLLVFGPDRGLDAVVARDPKLRACRGRADVLFDHWTFPLGMLHSKQVATEASYFLFLLLTLSFSLNSMGFLLLDWWLILYLVILSGWTTMGIFFYIKAEGGWEK